MNNKSDNMDGSDPHSNIIEHLNSVVDMESFTPPESVPLSRLDMAHSASSRDASTPTTPDQRQPQRVPGSGATQSPRGQLRIRTHDSDEPVLIDNLPQLTSTQIPRHSEDDDLERGGQEISLTLTEPEGSFPGLTTDEATT